MRLTLEDTWRECLSMWRWIAKRKKQGGILSASELKTRWLIDRKVFGLAGCCYFCEYAKKAYKRATGNRGNDPEICEYCPGRKVDKDFFCMKKSYDFDKKPIAFYNKLVSLNRKRLKGKK